ncbi:hypothetical protein FQA47_014157 [Oryzias melastigma]|uniref:Uncharacterized protein n=1 Tax=Oryzias melastigma TaxID=30732 RepID=A0A834EYI3_ORYME|nr:hypothetical protein FQA47_014157 [Oryzias melastigma]
MEKTPMNEKLMILKPTSPTEPPSKPRAEQKKNVSAAQASALTFSPALKCALYPDGEHFQSSQVKRNKLFRAGSHTFHRCATALLLQVCRYDLLKEDEQQRPSEEDLPRR